MSDIVNKLWGFCHTLKHDGIGYAFYVEQLTYMLFIKMAEERGVELPKKCDWNTLSNLSGTDLVDGYTDILRALGKTPGILGDIFAGAQNRFNKAVNLKKLISLIGEIEWTSLGEDVKAHAYEGLLEKAASEGKKGAGQYFTPRVLIQSIVRCMKPDPRAKADFTLCDPACGTGGFLVAVHEWLAKETKGAMERQVAKRVRSNTYFGGDIDQEPRRLALMNLYLHGIEPHIRLGDAIYEPASSERFDVILSNPPFGTRGANQAPDRDDFTVSTSNKQLNFMQHILTLLKPGGRAAVVLPDNCLFEDQAGDVFKILMEDCDLHTVLRLPRGTFTPYSNGVKANVIFFTKGAPSSTTWIYDARTNVPQITKKDRPLTLDHFREFESCFGHDPNGRAKRKASDSKDDRWRSFSVAEIRERAYKLDGFKWLKDESVDDGELAEPDELVTEAIAQLEASVSELNVVLRLLASSEEGTQAGDGLPEGWTTLTLAEAVEPNALIQYGILQPGPDVADGVPYVRPTEIVNDEIDLGSIRRTSKEIAAKYVRSSLLAQDVILSIVGSIGKVAVVPKVLEGANITQSSARLRPKAGVVESKYLAWFLRSPGARAQFQQAELGTGVPRLNIGDIRQMTMPLAPLPEQRRLIVQIEALVARIKKARNQLGRVPLVFRTEHDDRLTQAILGKAFSGGLVVSEAELATSEGRPFETADQLLKRIAAEGAAASSIGRGAAGGARRRGRPPKSVVDTAPAQNRGG